MVYKAANPNEDEMETLLKQLESEVERKMAVNSTAVGELAIAADAPSINQRPIWNDLVKYNGCLVTLAGAIMVAWIVIRNAHCRTITIAPRQAIRYDRRITRPQTMLDPDVGRLNQ